jgi:glutamate transport system permease protein
MSLRAKAAVRDLQAVSAAVAARAAAAADSAAPRRGSRGYGTRGLLGVVRRAAGDPGPGSTLFDQPGPRGKRHIAIATIAALAGLALLAWGLERRLAAYGQLSADKWQPFTQWPIIHYLLNGLLATLEVTAISGSIALPIGMLLALGRLSRTRLLRWPAALYTEVLRSVPLLLLIYAFLLGLPSTGLRLPLMWQLIWPIVATNSALLAEIFRAGMLAVDRGQTEAAQAIGLSRLATMRLVVVPQAVRQVSPSLVSQLIRLLKDSTLGYVVSCLELLYAAEVLGQYNHAVLQCFLVAAFVYVIVNNILAAVARRLELHTPHAPSPV